LKINPSDKVTFAQQTIAVFPDAHFWFIITVGIKKIARKQGETSIAAEHLLVPKVF